MNANSLLLLVAALSLHAAPHLVAAPLATAFTYQGKLNDGVGPASGSYDFRFTLYDAVVDGSQVGNTLTAENLPVVTGVFTATLDFGAVFDGSSRWIELAVRAGASLGDFSVLSPRQPLAATPFALYALTPAGPQGAAGPKGDAGLTGTAGPKGDKGDLGLTGLQGLTGLPGSVGAAGPKGDPGALGAAGSAGAGGPKGDKGDTGLTGPAGPQGATGAKGAIGTTGPAGAAGPQGVQGVVGAVGATGSQGAIGLTGATGATGPAGAKGVNWRGAWGAATAYLPNDAVAMNGSSWQAKLANTASAPFEGSANWDLLARKGDPGATGALGPAGAVGSTGPSGAQGPIGLTGSTGPIGPPGPQGSVGPQGPSGAFAPVGSDASFVGGNVGIGTSSPVSKLHVRSGADDLPSRLQSSGTTGFGAGWDFYQGDVGKGYVGVPDAAAAFAPGELMLFSGPDTRVSLWAGGARAVTVETDGRVGIGTATPVHKLEVFGPTRISSVSGEVRLLVANVVSSLVDLFVYGRAFKTEGGTSWEAFSDGRLKQDVQVYESGLKEILQLRSVRFRYRDNPKMGLTSTHEEVGFIAQEVREVIPDAITEGKDGYLTLKADPIHWAAINAIQQLNAKLETAVKEKDTRIAALERGVAELKELVNGLAQAKGGAQ